VALQLYIFLLIYHGSNSSVLEKQPVRHLRTRQLGTRCSRSGTNFNMLSRSKRIANLEILVVPSNQVLHYAAALEYPNLVPVSERIRNGRDTSIGIDLREPIRLLFVGRHVDSANFVWET
jgi:hypothetical protein